MIRENEEAMGDLADYIEHYLRWSLGDALPVTPEWLLRPPDRVDVTISGLSIKRVKAGSRQWLQVVFASPFRVDPRRVHVHFIKRKARMTTIKSRWQKARSCPSSGGSESGSPPGA